jgi:hypothetical protein
VGGGRRGSGGGLRGLIATLRRLVGRRPPDANMTSGGVTALSATAGLGASLPHHPGWQVPARPSAQVRWRKDFWSAPSSHTAARVRTIQRQILLVLIALVTVGTVGMVYGARLLVDRTLPVVVRGVWQTDGPRYEQRLFQLAGSRLAFQVSDSSAAIYQVFGVRQTVREASTLYQVEYRDQGESYEFSFVYSAGPPEEIRFAHQPFMVWTRVADRRRLLPELF